MSKRKSLNGMIESITTDIRKKTKAALEYAGQKISGDFTRMAYLALDKYYNEYTKPPRTYKRTDILRNDSYYAVNKRTGFKINAGVIFDEDRMNHENLGWTGHKADGNTTPFTEFAILSNFMHGIHGSEDVFVGENAQNKMDKYYQDYHMNNTAYNYFKEYMDR